MAECEQSNSGGHCGRKQEKHSDKGHKHQEHEQLSESVQLCSNGLQDRLAPTLEGLNDRMEKLTKRQVALGDKIVHESNKFRKAEEELQLREMVETTRKYLNKAKEVRRDMDQVKERSARLTQRAVALMEAKQKEAMERENRRQREAEMEEQLVAKPAKK